MSTLENGIWNILSFKKKTGFKWRKYNISNEDKKENEKGYNQQNYNNNNDNDKLINVAENNENFYPDTLRKNNKKSEVNISKKDGDNVKNIK